MATRPRRWLQPCPRPGACSARRARPKGRRNFARRASWRSTGRTRARCSGRSRPRTMCWSRCPPTRTGIRPWRVTARRCARRRRPGSDTSRPPVSMATGAAAGSMRTAPLVPVNQRGEWRVAAERAWLASGLPVHVFRLAGIYGPGRSAFDRLREGRARRIVKAGQVFCRVHVADIAQALRASMARPMPGRVYNVADDEPAPPQDVIAFAAELLGMPVPPEVAVRAGRAVADGAQLLCRVQARFEPAPSRGAGCARCSIPTIAPACGRSWRRAEAAELRNVGNSGAKS